MYGDSEITQAMNPVLRAEIPDMSVVRKVSIDNMTSTTMHLYRHVPIMKSQGLFNRGIVYYTIDILCYTGHHTLIGNANDYGRGSWAGSLRYNNGTWHVPVFSHTTCQNYGGSASGIEKGPWKTVSFALCYHDNTFF